MACLPHPARGDLGGSNTAIQIVVIRARRAGPDRISYFASEIEWYGTRVLVPTALALVIIGFILLHVSAGAYDLWQGWVTVKPGP